MISSIPAIPDAHACSGAPSEENPESQRQGVRLERRKNGARFPVPRANHQRFVAAITFSSEVAPVRVKRKRGRKIPEPRFDSTGAGASGAGIAKWQQLARAI
jgi:hypothetical protein